jgi:hypothetical protein
MISFGTMLQLLGKEKLSIHMSKYTCQGELVKERPSVYGG